MDKRTDAELVRLARAGDKNAFGQLIERYQQMTKRIALSMVANEQVAKELAQEAVLQAYLSLDHLRDEGRFKSWLYGIVLNVCRQRRKTMVKVTIADVVARKHEETEEGKQREHHIIVLLDEAGQRALPIWVGPFEGQTIAMGLRGLSTPRPVTFSFMASLLEAVEVELEEVRVEALRDDTFYGVVKVRNGDRVKEVDARPSDAIALAVRTGSPIYVADEVMRMAGIDVSKEMAQRPKLGQGLDGIVQEIEEKMTVEIKRCQEKLIEEMREDKTRQAQQEIIALVFGGER